MSKVWLITGCSTGFGRELAKHVLESGNQVAVTARKPADIQDIVDDHKENSIAIKLDVTKDDEILYCPSELLQPELMLGYLLLLKNSLQKTQLLQCFVGDTEVYS